VTDPARRRRVEEVCDAALDRDAGERTAFVAATCGDDDALRREVEALLAHAQTAEGFLATSMGAVAANVLGERGASLVGQQIGSYRILSLLGAGGMGDVYRARDTKLDRDVAIKVVPDAFLGDPERLARFEREARVLATLNHPHIGAIYGFEEADGLRALVLELVEGSTLAERLMPGPLPVQEALRVASQIASALEAAHDKGIVHRDLKPANIAITADGTVKLLDFGLATVIADAAGPALSHSPTFTIGRTGQGVILGTAAYMSPEQARGKPLDKRTDIWSFGCVLFEVLTGRQAHTGDTVSDTIAAILGREPEWDALPDATPASVRRLLQRCLEKDPAQRLRDIRDARLELDHAVVARASPRVWLRTTIAIALLALMGGALFWRARFAGAGSSEIRSVAVLPLQNLSGDADQEYFTDGTTEALISRLAQIHSLEVISRTSVMRFKGTTRPLRDIGRELGVDAIVEGSVQRAGGRVRITAQLIRAATDTHVWAGAYERDMADVLKVEADAAVAIAQQIQAYVTPDERQRLETAPRVQPVAHEEYLLGRHSLVQRADASVTKQAIEHFQRAIQLQPDYADAYAGLSSAFQQLHDVSGAAAEALKYLSAARAAAERALTLDPKLSAAHAVMAGVKFTEYDWQGAQKEYERALELDPNNLNDCVCYSTLLRAMGRLPEASAFIERAASTDPLSSAVQNEYGILLYYERKYREALSRVQRAIELDGRNRLAFYVLALTYEKLGTPEAAVAVLDRPEFRPSAELGLALASLGRRTDALNIVASLDKPGSPPDGVTLAALFFALKDKDRGFQWLTRAFDERQSRAKMVKFNPLFDDVRADPRFAALVATLNIPD
jgi:TolB-like protein/Tfp pilus assembly protein PilF